MCRGPDRLVGGVLISGVSTTLGVLKGFQSGFTGLFSLREGQLPGVFGSAAGDEVLDPAIHR